jgi:hypothetical protein
MKAKGRTRGCAVCGGCVGVGETEGRTTVECRDEDVDELVCDSTACCCKLEEAVVGS